MSESEKKKIALVVDSYDWCFYNIASQIKKHLSYKYNILLFLINT